MYLIIVFVPLVNLKFSCLHLCIFYILFAVEWSFEDSSSDCSFDFFFQYWFCLLGLLMQIAVLWLHFNCLYFFLIFSNNFLKSLPGFQLPIFPSQFVVSTTNLSTSLYRLFLLLCIIENLSNKKQQISKYIFVSCTRWWKICVHPFMSQDMFLGAMVFFFFYFYFYCYSSLNGERAIRDYCFPSKRIKFLTFLAFTYLNLHVISQAEDILKFRSLSQNFGAWNVFV